MTTTALAAAATLLAGAFAAATFERWLERRRRHELAWSAALVAAGAGTLSASGLLNSVADEMAAFAITLTAGITVLFAGFLLATSPAPLAAAVVSLPTAAGAAAPSRPGPVAARPRT